MYEELLKKLKENTDQPELIGEIFALLKKNTPDEKALAAFLKTADGLKEMRADGLTIAAGLWHYLPENTPLNLESIAPKEQQIVASIAKKTQQINELYLNFKNLNFRPISAWQKSIISEQAENLRKMFFVLTQDLRPLFVLLAHHWQLMKNVKDLPKEQQRWHSQAALEIMAPLAYGLGMLAVKGSLEDSAFPVLYPDDYQWLIENVSQQYEERQRYLDTLTPTLPAILESENINFLDIHKRAKHYFSLYQKLLRNDRDLNKIYDLVALRIIVADVENCYKALGALHKIWTPLPGRIKDYISQPKANGYRSLHTTVLAPGDITTEFQIKTLQMHQEAEYGAAAHLSYKGQAPAKTYKHQFYWIEQLRRWQEETQDAKKVSVFLKSEIFEGHIFVFTPQGDIISLPEKATPIDFAYAIHSDVGDHCQSAKINGSIAPIDRELKTGDTVEITTSKNQTPSERWLHFAVTKKAQERIRKFLQKKEGLEPPKPKIIESIAKGWNEKIDLIKKYIPLPKKKEPRIVIGGQSAISYKLSQCCKPRPGDTIAAFIKQGEAASIHKTNCKEFGVLQEKAPDKVATAVWE